jgi:adenylate kinase
LGQLGHALDRVLELVVEEEELVRRLSGRRMLVDGEWVQREDDRAETVRHRLEVYREQTAPLSGFYESEGLLTRIDAIGEVEEVTARAMEALGAADGQPAAG